MKSGRWIEVTESRFPWEREALGHLRKRLPDSEPFRAWSNFEFIARDGSINEVDLLLVSLYKIYLVEIKSRPGRLSGDAGTWTWPLDGRDRVEDNPLLLANRKEKKLKALLGEATAATPLAALGLSARVLDALERIGAHTLGELVKIPRIRLYRNKGIGQKTVREIRDPAERVAVPLARRESEAVQPQALPVPAESDPLSVEARFWSVDLLVSKLLGGREAPLLEGLLGLIHPGPRSVAPAGRRHRASRRRVSRAGPGPRPLRRRTRPLL